MAVDGKLSVLHQRRVDLFFLREIDCHDCLL